MSGKGVGGDRSASAPLGAFQGGRLGGKGGKWTIQRADGLGAWVDASNSSAMLPADAYVCPYCQGSHGRAVRAHEMAHLEITPNDWPTRAVSMGRTCPRHEYLNAAEDVRVNAFVASRLGYPLDWRPSCPRMEREILKQTGKVDPWDSLVKWASIGAPKANRRYVQAALEGRPGADKEGVASFLAKVGDAANRVQRWQRHGEEAREVDDAVLTLATLIAPPPPEDAQRCSGGEDVSPFKGDSSDAMADSANMDLVTLPMPLYTTTKKWRPNLVGLVRHAALSRMTGSLSLPRRQKGQGEAVSVLIDASGSMAKVLGRGGKLLAGYLERTRVRRCALYCGNGNQGALIVVARDGKRAKWEVVAKTVSKYGGGNTVDYPALLWLGKQPGRRLWVCDGGVTGKRDAPRESITLGCAKLQAAYGITRIEALP